MYMQHVVDLYILDFYERIDSVLNRNYSCRSTRLVRSRNLHSNIDMYSCSTFFTKLPWYIRVFIMRTLSAELTHAHDTRAPAAPCGVNERTKQESEGKKVEKQPRNSRTRSAVRFLHSADRWHKKIFFFVETLSHQQQQ